MTLEHRQCNVYLTLQRIVKSETVLVVPELAAQTRRRPALRIEEFVHTYSGQESIEFLGCQRALDAWVPHSDEVMEDDSQTHVELNFSRKCRRNWRR